MKKIMMILVVLFAIVGSSFAIDATIKVKHVEMQTYEYGAPFSVDRKQMILIGSDDKVYTYNYGDDPLRLSIAKTFISMLMFAQSNSRDVYVRYYDENVVEGSNTVSVKRIMTLRVVGQ